MPCIEPKTLSEWSAAIRARDGKCLRCAATVALVAHHIKSKARHPELRLSLENGETLCSNCHIEHHRHNPDTHADAKRATRKAKVALLKAENRALKAEIAALRRAVEPGDQIAQLKAQLAEYERAYAAMTQWEPEPKTEPRGWRFVPWSVPSPSDAVLRARAILQEGKLARAEAEKANAVRR